MLLSGSERINLFAVIQDEQYKIAGRYSENTSLSNTTPTDQTLFKPFLDVAFKSENGDCFMDQLPDFDEDHGLYLDTLKNSIVCFINIIPILSHWAFPA